MVKKRTQADAAVPKMTVNHPRQESLQLGLRMSRPHNLLDETPLGSEEPVSPSDPEGNLVMGAGDTFILHGSSRRGLFCHNPQSLWGRS